MTELCHSPTTSEDVAKYSAQDLILAKVMVYINNRWPTEIEEQYKSYLRMRNDIYLVSIGEAGL